MQVANATLNIPTGLRYFFTDASQKWGEYSAYIGETDVWKEWGQPTYAHHIAPLEITDYLFIAASIVTTIFIIVLLKSRRSVFARPLALLGTVACLATAYQLIKIRLEQHFTPIAWDLLSHLKGLIEGNPSTEEIERIQEQLRGPEFGHLNGELTYVDEELRALRVALLHPDQNTEQQRLNFITLLDAILNRLMPTRPFRSQLIEFVGN